jgi:toxin ParE1/3/4
VAHKVVFDETALVDLQSIFLYVAEGGGLERAEAYDARIRQACLKLMDFPRRGTPRDDLRAGLRTIVFERQATIAYLVEGATVRIVAILHRGRDAGVAFGSS